MASALVLGGVHLTPAAVAVATSVGLSRLEPRPPGAAALLIWLGCLGAVTSVVVVTCNRVVRRLLPLAALLRLTLVFPDRAPSRFRSAIRTASARDLERRLEEARQGGHGGETLNEAAIRIVELSALLTAHDRRTRGHCERVRAYAEMMGEELGLAGDELNKLRWGAMLHDIGKLEVPAGILNKRGRPDATEWAAIRRHPDEGHRLLEPLLEWLGPWASAAWEHHERWDGSGYPAGLSRRTISRAGRIVAVADAYEVMTATRSYKKPMTAAAARRELQRAAGSQFDPEMVRALLNVSIGRLRWEMGPVAWLAQLPFLSWTVPAATGAPAAIATVGRAAALAGVLQATAPNFVAASFDPPSSTARTPAALRAQPALASSQVHPPGSAPSGAPVPSEWRALGAEGMRPTRMVVAAADSHVAVPPAGPAAGAAIAAASVASSAAPPTAMSDAAGPHPAIASTGSANSAPDPAAEHAPARPNPDGPSSPPAIATALPPPHPSAAPASPPPAPQPHPAAAPAPAPATAPAPARQRPARQRPARQRPAGQRPGWR